MIRLLTHPLYQWDTGRMVMVIPRPGTTVEEVHCHNKTTDDAVTLIIDSSYDTVTCKIPDTFLTTSNDLVFYAVMKDDTGKYTTESAMFKIHKRPKPDDYVYREDEIKTWESIRANIDKLERDVKNLSENGNVDLTGVVKSVNGTVPDENGNVEITIPDSGGNVDMSGYEDVIPPAITGVVGDGVTSDAVAIQNLLDTHDYVYLPKGTYLVDSNPPLTMSRDNCTFICDGTLVVNTTVALELTASYCNVKIAHIKAKWNGSWNETDRWKFTVSALKLHAVTKSVMYNNIEVGFIERCINGFWFVPDGQSLGIAHNTITFRDVYAERGIYFAPGEQEYVFINGNHFYGGQLRGNHPIYTQKGTNQSDPFNGNTFNHIAMEGCQKPMTLQFFYMNKFSDMRLASRENTSIVHPNPLLVFDEYSFGNTIETHAQLGIDRIVDPEKETNRLWEKWLGNLYIAKTLYVGSDDNNTVVGTTGRTSYGFMVVDNESHVTTRVQNTTLDLSTDKYVINGRTFQCVADTNNVVITLPMGYRQRAATDFYVYIESITSPHTVTVMQDGVEIIPANVMTDVGLYKAELITSIGWIVTKVEVEHRLPEASLPELKESQAN